MKKTLMAVTAAAAVAVATMAVPERAEAHAWWWIPVAVVGGVVVGGAIASQQAQARYAESPPVRYAPRAQYAPAYSEPRAQYAPPRARGAVRVRSRSRCELVEQPTAFGGYRVVEVCG